MTSQAAFLLMWTIVAFVGTLAAAAVLVWAVRRGQFSDQDRARYLPLGGDVPRPTNPDDVAPVDSRKKADHAAL